MYIDRVDTFNKILYCLQITHSLRQTENGNLKMVRTKNMEIKGLLDLELTEQLNSIYKHYIFIFSLEGS